MRLIIAILLTIATTNLVFTQNRSTDNERVDEILSDLDLSQMQREKMQSLQIKYKDLFESNAKTAPTREARIARRKSLQRDIHLEMREILTPTQLRQFREKLRQAREIKGPGELMETLASLDLSEDQKSQIKSLLTEQRPKIKDLRASNLPEDDKRSQLKKIREATLSSLKGILSPEQFDVLRLKMRSRDQEE